MNVLWKRSTVLGKFNHLFEKKQNPIPVLENIAKYKVRNLKPGLYSFCIYLGPRLEMYYLHTKIVRKSESNQTFSFTSFVYMMMRIK